MNQQCSLFNYAYKSAWYTLNQKDDFLSRLNTGDLIEFQRGIGLYDHWAVFAGYSESSTDDSTPQVFHAGPRVELGNVFSSSIIFDKGQHSKGSVSKACLFEVWGSSPARINNELDDEFPPFDKNEILLRAELRYKNHEKYHLFKNNCEQFAKWCRNGIEQWIRGSDQVCDVMRTGISLTFSFGCVAIAGVITMMLKMREDFEDEFGLYGDSADETVDDDDVDERDGAEKKKKNKLKRMSISLD